MLGLDLGADESDDGEEFAPAGKKVAGLFNSILKFKKVDWIIQFQNLKRLTGLFN